MKDIFGRFLAPSLFGGVSSVKRRSLEFRECASQPKAHSLWRIGLTFCLMPQACSPKVHARPCNSARSGARWLRKVRADDCQESDRRLANVAQVFALSLRALGYCSGPEGRNSG